jgi:hypothetical protein
VAHNWVQKFSQGRLKGTNDAPLGHPVETMAEATVQWVEDLLRDDRIMIDRVATTLGCSYGLAHIIMHDHLKSEKCEHGGCPEN